MTALSNPLFDRVTNRGYAASVSHVRRTDTCHFLIGVVPVTVRCPHGPTLRAFRDVYSQYQLDRPHPDAIRIDVVRASDRLRPWYRFEVWADGVRRYSFGRVKSMVPRIEWAINWQIMHYLPRYFELHAGVVEIDGEGVIFPAVSGSGKSTLVTALVSRGWRYLSDEFALIDPDSLLLHPYPKAICMKEGSFEMLASMGHAPARRHTHVHRRKGSVTFIDPRRFGEVRREPCPIRHVIFCRYDKDRPPTIRPISRADAVLRLHAQSFNFSKFKASGIRIMSDVVRQARCHELRSGAIDETCDLVSTTVREMSG